MSSFQWIGEDGERQGEHCCPRATDEEETYEEKVLIVDEINRSKTYTSEKKTQRIDELLIFEEGNHRCPQHRTHGLHCKQNTHPVACFIVSITRGVQHNHSVFQHCWSVENVVCYRTIGVSPHKHKGCPAEELHQTYCPESGRSFNQQCEQVGRLRFLFAFCLIACVCRSIRSNLVIFVVELRRIFLYRQCGVDDTEDEDGCTTIEGINHRVGHLSLFCCVAHCQPSENYGEKISHKTTCIAEERLNGVSRWFLFFVHHVAHHHFEGLHSNVDTRVEKHERYQPENHSHSHAHTKTSGIRKKAHHQNSDESTHK